MHKSAEGKTREERVRQVIDGDPSVHDYASYIPVGNAVEKLKSIQARKDIPLFILAIYPMSSLGSPEAFADIKPERFIDISSATPTKVAEAVKDELGIK